MIHSCSFSHLQSRFGGELIHGDVTFQTVSTNTRDMAYQDVFVALKGERFDAHEFIQQAVEKGACGLVVEHVINGLELPQWVVSDTTLALGHIAEVQRDQFEGKLVAITGSGGKTTVKGMLFSILETAFNDKVFATQGNLNNHIGVPFSLFSLASQHEYAVIEMGASAVGEIAYLTHMAKPHVALVNNVMAAHVEGFGSIDNIATAKGEIYEGLSEQGIAVVNVDDHYAPQWLLQNTHRSTLTYSVNPSQHPHADVQAHNIQQGETGCVDFQLYVDDVQVPVSLHVLGLHNVANALAAATCAYALGLDAKMIAQGLAHFMGVAGRLQRLQGINNSTIIDDSYNANPSSVCAAIDVLAGVPAKKILILGDMAELGDAALQAHQDVGLYGRDKNIDYLLSVGTHTKAASDRFAVNNFHFDHMDQLIEAAKVMADNQTVFLIKGSRSSRMDKVVQALIQRGENNNASLVS
jgi:UDP-N-acetylmuramoyl-tripeptide--D-alanyl-D-alanine ligase